MSFVSRSPGLLSHSAAGPHFPWHVFFCWCILVALHIPHQIQLHIGLAFLTVFLNLMTVPLRFSWVTCPIFCLLHTYPLHLSVARHSLFIHVGLLTPSLDFLHTGMDPFWKMSHFCVSFGVQHTNILLYFGGSSLRLTEPTLFVTLILLVHCSIPN